MGLTESIEEEYNCTIEIKEEPLDDKFEEEYNCKVEIKEEPQGYDIGITNKENNHMISNFKRPIEKRNSLSNMMTDNDGDAIVTTTLNGQPSASDTYDVLQLNPNIDHRKRIETIEKPFKCDWTDCNATYINSSILARHKLMHTGEKSFKCDWNDCIAAFTQLSDLTLHNRIHRGEKPYKCDWANCNASFTQISSLAIHKRIHTGEKPYKCNWTGCCATFADSRGFSRHKRTHGVEKNPLPYTL